MRLILKISFLLFFLFLIGISAQPATELHKRQALLHMQAGRYGEAIDLLNKYISANAREPEGYNLRGLCFEQREQYQSSVLDLRRATRLEPTNQDYQNNLQRVLSIWHKMLYERIEGYKREIAIDPSNPFNYLEVGKSYRWLEEWAMAELWYDEYLARDDVASADEIIRYTEILSHTGSITKGERTLARYVEIYPDDWRLWSRYGYFTMWLGNYRNAERAFRTSLSFKPFFKEAQDGLDLALREGYMVLQTPRSFEREDYPIDRYYRILRNDPNNDEVRFTLIQNLVNENRFEEAYEQLQYLAPNYEGTERYDQLRDYVLNTRQTHYESKIDSAQTELKIDPSNREALISLVDYYSNLDDYDSAMELLSEYLEMNPDDTPLRFRLAQLYSYQRMLDEAQEQMELVLEDNQQNLEYLLLAGQLAVWSDDNLDQGEEYLETVLQNDPTNINAIVALGSLNFQQQEYQVAQSYNTTALSLAPDNPDVQQLNSMLELHFIREEEQKKLERLEEGRTLAMNGNYEAAIPYYEEYFAEANPTVDLRYELADVYVGADRYFDAIQLYDQTLQESYDPEMDKMRAKVIFWSGDSLRALDEFERLAEEDPDDMEMKLYLGDSYTQMDRYDSARTVYNSMLEEGAPESYVIEERLDWLPVRPEDENFLVKGFRYLGGYVLSYLAVQPVAYYFADDLEFSYRYWGGNIETSFLPYLSGGVTWLRGNLANDFGDFNYTTLKGNLFVRPIDNLIFRFSYGEMYSPGILRTPVVEAGVKYDHKNREGSEFGFNISYTRSDASTILYSPGLVFTRLTGQLGDFRGYYEFETNVRLEAIFQLIHTKAGTTILGNGVTQLPDNLGNNFIGRIARWFYPNLIAGYEYLFTDFQRTIPVYYSPQDFHQHSIYAEWTPHKDEHWDIMVGGKLGYVPESDYVVRELRTNVKYTVTEYLRFMLTGYFSNTFREESGYTSGSISLTALWSIY